MKIKSVLLLVALLIGGVAGVIPCHADVTIDEYKWNSLYGSGSWQQSSAWGLPTGSYPGDGGRQNSMVAIDGDAVMNNSVTLLTNVKINGLVVTPGDGLAINNCSLGTKNVNKKPLTIANYGSIDIMASAADAGIYFYSNTGAYKGSLSGTGTITLESIDKHYASIMGWFTIDPGITITGRGIVSAAYTPVGEACENFGRIVATWGLLRVNGPFYNSGTMTTADIYSILELVGSITGGHIDPGEGRLRLADYAILENAQVSSGKVEVTSNYSPSTLGNGVHLAAGTTVELMKLSGAPGSVLNLGKSAKATITNDGLILVNPTTALVGQGGTLTGSGQVVLVPGTVAASITGSLINDTLHTIRGAGYIYGTITNKGNILVENGTLTSTGTINNYSGTIATSLGNELQLYGDTYGGQIDPHDGLVSLAGTLTNITWGAGAVQVPNTSGTTTMQGYQNFNAGTTLNLKRNLTVTGARLVNDGLINLNGHDLVSAAGSTTTLSGSGKTVLGGGSLNGGYTTAKGTFINDTHHTIEGAGTLKAPLENRGTLSVNTGTLGVLHPITGAGNVILENNAIFSLSSSLQTGNLSMSKDSYFQRATFDVVDLSGNLSFAQQSASLWELRDLQMSGGLVHPLTPWQSLEVGGKDLGESFSGLIFNFSLYSLNITGDKSYVYLVDALDNGDRGPGNSPEVLYVRNLTVAPGATLNLNGIDLYVDIPGHSVHLLNTWTGDLDWLGGGKILNEPFKPVPVPSTLLLFGPGLLGLAVFRRFCQG